MGVAQKTMFSISDRLAKFFGISGAPMVHNTTAKSKQTFLLEIRPFWHKRPLTIVNFNYDTNILELLIELIVNFCDVTIFINFILENDTNR